MIHTKESLLKREKEDQIIINMIKKYPTNLKYAHKQAAIVIGASLSSISGRYYQRIKKNLENPVIAIGNEQGLVLNTKNTMLKSDTSNEVRKALLIAVFNAVPLAQGIEFMLINLTNQEQQVILERMISKLKTA